MNKEREQPPRLGEAQRLIVGNCVLLSEEDVSLVDALDRYPSHSLPALEPLPGYDQSLRDGYAIGRPKQETKAAPFARFRIVGEVAAGDTRSLRLQKGEAVRIMTGGLVPAGCRGVVPQEVCQRLADEVTVPISFLDPPGSFIHRRGRETAKGRVVASRGYPIRPEHLIVLAGVGYDTVPVVRRPRVSFLSTGSELVSQPGGRVAGQKFSANPALLENLIRNSGAIPQDLGMVEDEVGAVLERLAAVDCASTDVIITTGGMGPGKYDLIEETFTRLGGKVLYRSLHLRPGKSTLFGTLGSCLFFGLPGPPPAVQLLFSQLVRPALLSLQGAHECGPERIHAFLAEDLELGKRGLPRLKSGVLMMKNGCCLVRPGARGEPSSCYIYCPANRRLLRKDEKVRVHLALGNQPTFPLFQKG